MRSSPLERGFFNTMRAEVEPFINNWVNKPQEEVVEELASYSMETKRIPDFYYFSIDADGDLYHPQGRTKVRNFIRRDIFVGELEGQAFDVISSWFKQEDSGVIVWVSPPYPGVYPASKIIISEIGGEGKGKRLYNWAIVLDFDEERCFKLAQDLTAFSRNHPVLNHLDQVRATPLALNTQGKNWIYILEELITDTVVWTSIKEGGARKAKAEAIMQAKAVYQRLFRDNVEPLEGQEMMLAMLGEKMGSCPSVLKTAFSVFSGSSSLVGISKSFLLGGETESEGKSCVSCGEVNYCTKKCYKCGGALI